MHATDRVNPVAFMHVGPVATKRNRRIMHSLMSSTSCANLSNKRPHHDAALVTQDVSVVQKKFCTSTNFCAEVSQYGAHVAQTFARDVLRTGRVVEDFDRHPAGVTGAQQGLEDRMIICAPHAGTE